MARTLATRAGLRVDLRWLGVEEGDLVSGRVAQAGSHLFDACPLVRRRVEGLEASPHQGQPELTSSAS